MKAREIGPQRLRNLQVVGSRCRTAGELVAALGAMQAQDYAGGLWAIGLRIPGASLPDVERELAARTFVRSWPLRGTLHFVAAADIHWMLTLLAPRVLAKTVRRREALELDDTTLRKIERTWQRALEGGRQLTRDAMGELLSRAGVEVDGGRLYHALLHFSLRQLLCFAVPEGKQQTFALLDEWVKRPQPLEPEQALATLAQRYFSSHGPATQQDLMRWAGLTAAEAKRAIAAASGLQLLDIDGRRHWAPKEEAALPAEARGMFLLPGFDEYILGYADRTAILDAEHASKIVPGSNGVFRPTIIHAGRVFGTWKADAGKKNIKLTASVFAAYPAPQQRAFARAAERYAAFMGKSATLV